MSEYAYLQTPKKRTAAAAATTPFKTPKSYRMNKENQPSDDSDTSTTSSNGVVELSIVAEFDDLVRLIRQQRHADVEDIFLSFAEQAEELRVHWLKAVEECRRLQMLLDGKTHELGDVESKLNHARRLVDHEKRLARKAEDERDILELQLAKFRDAFTKDFQNTAADNRDKMNFLNTISSVLDRDKNVNLPSAPPQLSDIREGNTTGSLLSDFSYSRSEDDLDVSMQAGKAWKKHRPSAGAHVAEPCTKKRRSSAHKVVEISNADTVRATTTLTVPKHGPITATSVIESVPQEGVTVHQQQPPARPTSPPPPRSTLLANTPAPLHQLFSAWQQHGSSPLLAPTTPNPTLSLLRQHQLQPKTVVMPDTCSVCERRVRFGRAALKCRECRALIHPECRERLAVPCVPCAGGGGGGGGGGTPKGDNGNSLGLISDYTPTSAPMVPALIVHCLREIEARGFTEVGIYRIPGSEREVKTLKERFLRGRGAPPLTTSDVHALCGTVKDFLRSLAEPVVTRRLWPAFIRAASLQKESDIGVALQSLVGQLPQPNRDTLAYVVLHLKRVADQKECKMPSSNLAKIFGPTIIGYSSNDLEPANIMSETRQQVMTMQWLINQSEDYWSSVLSVPRNEAKLQQTPSTDSLLRPSVTRMFFTPNITRSGRKPQKFFPTPPN